LLRETAAAAIVNHIVSLREVRGKLIIIKIVNYFYDILTTFTGPFINAAR
jgi:hypothetical protein